MNGLGMFGLFGLMNPFKLLSGITQAQAGESKEAGDSGCPGGNCGDTQNKGLLNNIMAFILPGI